MAATTLPPQGAPDFTKLRPRAVLTHNTYEILTQNVPDATQPGGFVQVSSYGRLLTSAEIVDFQSCDIHLSLGLAADTFSITLPNTNGKYTSAFAAGEEIAVNIGYPIDPNNYNAADLPQLIIGRIDDVDFDFDKDAGETVIIAGRNYVAPFLDNRVSKKYENMTATQIVQAIVNLYGFGVDASILVPNDRKFNRTKVSFNKSYITRSGDTALVLAKHNTNALADIPPSVLNPKKNSGVTRTTKIIDNVIGKNDTAWKVLQDLALALADPNTGLEYKVYVEGKKLYFGPRQDSLTPSTTMTYGITALNIRLRETSQFLKTRIIMRNYLEKRKKTYDVIIPDDLGPDIISDAEKNKYLALRKKYGVRDLLVKDLRKFIEGDVHLAKITGLARLRENARLTYTGTVEIPGDPLITKEGTVKLAGIPDANGQKIASFPYLVSTTLNAVYYIEGTKHTYSKDSGFVSEVSLSTRRPDQVRKLQASSSAAAAPALGPGEASF